MQDFNCQTIFNYYKNSFNSILIKNVASLRKVNYKLEKSCNEEWKKIKKDAEKQGRKIWDSEIYRFEKAKIVDNSLFLEFSSIPFSIRFAMNKYTDEVGKLGIEYASLGIFNSCFVVSSDNKYLFIEKSNKYYSERKNSFIGGVLSKTEKYIKNENDLLGEASKEVREEIGINEENINEIVLVSGYITENYNFCLVFLVKIKKTFKEVLEIFKENNDGEVKRVIGIDKEKLKDFSLNNLPEKDYYKFKEVGLFNINN